ncbi:MAG: hypothetical protein RL518_2819 [Pseudomonadota bacterium]|jgi:hypothetical protein
MFSTIVTDDTGSKLAVLEKVKCLNDINATTDIIVVSTDSQPAEWTTGIWIQAATMVAGLAKAAQLAASKRIIVMSSAVEFQPADLARLVAELDTRQIREHTLIISRTESGLVQLPDLSAENVFNSISKTETWPLTIVATSRFALSMIGEDDAQSATEFLAQALVRSIADGDTIRHSTLIDTIISSANLAAINNLSDEARARILKATIDAFNIEELFPNHNWVSYSQESAAASYHSIAALFLRFGDPESAAECLDCSERLEESPRYFALQGLIHKQKGETLGAVASFVSSLQCYEARKVDNGQHYITFKPNNLEVINSRLVDGLNALNKRDNDSALTYFSEAVFNFDPFYAEHGVLPTGKTR